MADVLTLGGIIFDNAKYMTPNKMPFGGSQSINVHKLPGGGRVYDVLGPDEGDISFSGFILDGAAFQINATLDALRQSGQVVALVFCGTYRQVIVKSFGATVRRFPNWVEYSISCTVVSNPLLGNLSGISSTPAGLVASLITADIAVALGIVQGSFGIGFEGQAPTAGQKFVG